MYHIIVIIKVFEGTIKQGHVFVRSAVVTAESPGLLTVHEISHSPVPVPEAENHENLAEVTEEHGHREEALGGGDVRVPPTPDQLGVVTGQLDRVWR